MEMTNGELFLLGINTTVIGMGIVFLVLIFLSGAIVLQSLLLVRKGKKPSDDAPKNNRLREIEKKCTTQSGDTIIQGVGDEETIALIMAVVSDAAGIAIGELKFKSIRAI
jgi:sodium pump decarboxylase gamma subunit